VIERFLAYRWQLEEIADKNNVNSAKKLTAPFGEDLAQAHTYPAKHTKREHALFVNDEIFEVTKTRLSIPQCTGAQGFQRFIDGKAQKRMDSSPPDITARRASWSSNSNWIDPLPSLPKVRR
jgi:hypothetical protein